MGNILFCSYSRVLLCTLSNSARTWSNSSVKRLLGAGTPIPRCALYMLGYSSDEAQAGREMASCCAANSALTVGKFDEVHKGMDNNVDRSRFPSKELQMNCRSEKQTKILRLLLYKSRKLINVTKRRCGRRWTGVKIGHGFQRDATHELIRR